MPGRWAATTPTATHDVAPHDATNGTFDDARADARPGRSWPASGRTWSLRPRRADCPPRPVRRPFQRRPRPPAGRPPGSGIGQRIAAGVGPRAADVGLLLLAVVVVALCLLALRG